LCNEPSVIRNYESKALADKGSHRGTATIYSGYSEVDEGDAGISGFSGREERADDRPCAVGANDKVCSFFAGVLEY
jgi:hypothetical protein